MSWPCLLFLLVFYNFGYHAGMCTGHRWQWCGGLDCGEVDKGVGRVHRLLLMPVVCRQLHFPDHVPRNVNFARRSRHGVTMLQYRFCSCVSTFLLFLVKTRDIWKNQEENMFLFLISLFVCRLMEMDSSKLGQSIFSNWAIWGRETLRMGREEGNLALRPSA